eukprot:11182320-Lingulodinium_polyedra.AAC.1
MAAQQFPTAGSYAACKKRRAWRPSHRPARATMPNALRCNFTVNTARNALLMLIASSAVIDPFITGACGS